MGCIQTLSHERWNPIVCGDCGNESYSASVPSRLQLLAHRMGERRPNGMHLLKVFI